MNESRAKFEAKWSQLCHAVIHDLNQFGICVIDDFLDSEMGHRVLSEVSCLYNEGRFQAGQLVNNKANDTTIVRSDHILWVDGSETNCTSIAFLMATLDAIVYRCNRMKNNGLMAQYNIKQRTKAMIACYPGDMTKYILHVDNPNEDGRCITSIYYLNTDYDRERDGGLLRMFPKLNAGFVADIEPKFDRVIFFWSDRRNPHEVLPSMRKRFAITLWYFDADERKQAIERYNQMGQHPVDQHLRPLLTS